ncbi:MAG: hypothetical protein COX77_04690 [Candidatus Komeilibacteria bacterium CG_4_10_14_0_2_um_filter_37_10]|uniref:Iron hydrogenase n=1 Tax=Candidatus Komeilibacteria bacterium CG_4_10_14_0_2_um_filter_37_10 TaxID=1974470 RepID=A0A2M7VDR0_9BACT|nr:MAG: hypothetical protein COX77_04690 [Candidatus Komeilibacteria bacterium CG_4_10_14_0_2_um_filter_37_10]PJA93877.1 MAG: hypothetical protein CO133_00910 [Candidatus Komeilibacteria bacterium CG_4_9_14_3_um_filter_37_5]
MLNNIQEQALEKTNTQTLSQFIGLASVATILPFVLHLQLVTGPIINAIFILLLFLVGIRSALVVALIPSLMALSGGLLPAVLAPVVPFIMISNIIFILSIDRCYDWQPNIKGYWLGVFTGAILKFAFLSLSVSWITKLLLRQELASAVSQMMSWPQLVTAILGGTIAWIILKGLKKL